MFTQGGEEEEKVRLVLNHREKVPLSRYGTLMSW